MMRASAYGALHTLLVLFDGGAAIAEAGSAGRLQLLWQMDDDLVDLTDPLGSPALHDLLAEIRG